MGTRKHSQMSRGEGLSLGVQSTISPKERGEAESELVLWSTCLELNCLNLCPKCSTLSALCDLGKSLPPLCSLVN